MFDLAVTDIDRNEARSASRYADADPSDFDPRDAIDLPDYDVTDTPWAAAVVTPGEEPF